MMVKLFLQLLDCACQTILWIFLWVLLVACVTAIIRLSSFSSEIDWRATYASLVTTVSCGYVSFRFAIHDGNFFRSLPSWLLVRLILVITAQTALWYLVALGTFDLPLRLISPMSDYWTPHDFPGGGLSTWSVLALKLLAAYAVLILMGRLALFRTKPKAQPLAPESR